MSEEDALLALREFFANDPMKVVIVEDQVGFDLAVREHEAKGLRLACISNTGLPIQKRRLTFLPASAFTDGKNGS